MKSFIIGGVFGALIGSLAASVLWAAMLTWLLTGSN